MKNKPIYKLMDSKGRVLIPKELRTASGMDYGDIVRLGLSSGTVSVQKVDIIEIGDQSPEAVEAYVRAAFKTMPDDTRLSLISDLTALLQQKKEGWRMERNILYTEKHCSATGLGCSIQGKVVVISHDSPERQLYFCLCGNGAGANPSGSAVFLVSLRTGEFALKNRSEVIGIVRPELLPDSAKLQLSQIRPVGALDLKNHEPKYSGYSFLPDGRYASGVWLCTEQEALNYVEMQKPYQHRIMLCDRDDFCVLELQNGKLIHPSEKEMEAFRNPENGGMTMT